ncbi:hypothetical protein CEXT_398301 [Caerostris extrusa]|uniref:Uncharacterized protein n=1 Tax=Caerostris extrusa TaxID=172846 RepID=A0AAV4Y880_CAEEX|nr:hypothetical protein CEXT_398301 [Caerostris extrusa]
MRRFERLPYGEEKQCFPYSRALRKRVLFQWLKRTTVQLRKMAERCNAPQSRDFPCPYSSTDVSAGSNPIHDNRIFFTRIRAQSKNSVTRSAVHLVPELRMFGSKV